MVKSIRIQVEELVSCWFDVFGVDALEQPKCIQTKMHVDALLYLLSFYAAAPASFTHLVLYAIQQIYRTREIWCDAPCFPHSIESIIF